jgi:hypothetical protein
MQAMQATSARQGGAHVSQPDHPPVAIDVDTEGHFDDDAGLDVSADATPATASGITQRSANDIMAELGHPARIPTVIPPPAKASTATQPGTMASLATK